MLGNKQELQTLCKSLATLDAILYEDWEYRYYSYNDRWDLNEECFTMRNGEGDELLILFKDNSCVINGFLKEIGKLDTSKLKSLLPTSFHSFIYGEPVKSLGTSFCIWTNELGNWNSTDFIDIEDNIASFLEIYMNDPKKYAEWALEYYELDTLDYESIQKVYIHTPLTKELANMINPNITDFSTLINDLEEIGYPFDFSKNQ